MSKPREDRPLPALGLGLVTFFLFAMTDTSAKVLVTSGVPVMLVVFSRYLGNFIMVLAIFVPTNGRAAFQSNVLWLQILRGGVLVASTVLNFWALKYLPLTTTIPIFFAAPLLVCLLSVPFLGEKVGARRYGAVLVGFIGVLLIVRPGAISFHPAMFLSLAATTGASFYFIFTRMVAGRDDMPVSQIYAIGIPTIALLPFAIRDFTLPNDPTSLALMVFIGIFAGLGHVALTLANRFAEASKIAPLVYTQIIYITLISWVLFHELPDRWTVLGTAIIVASGLYVWLRERAAD